MRLFDSNGAGRVQAPLGFNVGGVGFFGRSKVSKIHNLAVNLNNASPLSMIEVSAKQTASVSTMGSPLVADVFGFTDNSKIGYPVVITNTVDVVNFARRHLAINIKPRKPMQAVTGVIDFCAKVPLAIIKSSNIPDVNGVNWSHTPSKNASLGVVVQKFAQTFCGKIGLSHAVVLLKRWFGQKPDSVRSGFGLRHFNMGGA